MIVELIMHVMDWSDVWYAHPGPTGVRGLLQNRCEIVWPGRWHVGVFTGPQNDLICTRHCETNEEANRWLSPGRPTILLAAMAAIAKELDGMGDDPAHALGGE